MRLVRWTGTGLISLVAVAMLVTFSFGAMHGDVQSIVALSAYGVVMVVGLLMRIRSRWW